MVGIREDASSVVSGKEEEEKESRHVEPEVLVGKESPGNSVRRVDDSCPTLSGVWAGAGIPFYLPWVPMPIEEVDGEGNARGPWCIHAYRKWVLEQRLMRQEDTDSS